MLLKVCAGLLISAFSFHSLADCSQLKGCDKKYCEIEKQLQIAKDKNNRPQVSGLTKSLDNAKKNCTNAGLKNELSEKIKEANADITEYEDGLQKAKIKGDVKKVTKYQKKIEQKKIEIKGFEKDLAEID